MSECISSNSLLKQLKLGKHSVTKSVDSHGSSLLNINTIGLELRADSGAEYHLLWNSDCIGVPEVLILPRIYEVTQREKKSALLQSQSISVDQEQLWLFSRRDENKSE